MLADRACALSTMNLKKNVLWTKQGNMRFKWKKQTDGITYGSGEYGIHTAVKKGMRHVVISAT